jgi:hypothetical protein
MAAMALHGEIDGNGMWKARELRNNSVTITKEVFVLEKGMAAAATN